VRAGEKLSADELRAFCGGQIARHKVPRHIRFVDGFPMTVTGKVQKFKMREQMKAELGLVDVKTA
jgi:fatty-acyl-CoA synthase